MALRKILQLILFHELNLNQCISYFIYRVYKLKYYMYVIIFIIFKYNIERLYILVQQ